MVTVCLAGQETNMALYRPRWTGSEGEITLGGHTYTFRTSNFWATQFEIRDDAGKVLEFGTATQTEHRNRCLSTATATACVSASLTRGFAPAWHCWNANTPSIAVARKVGFRLQRDYTIYKLWVPTPAS